MKYYWWTQDMYERAKGKELWYIDIPFMDELGVEEKEPVTEWDPNLIGTYPSGDCPRRDFPMTLNDWPLYSPRLRELMERLAPDSFQALPIRLQNEDGEGEVPGYSVIQYLRWVECIDRKRTEVRDGSWEPINSSGDYAVGSSTTMFFLDRAKIEAEKLFRIQGMSTHVVIRQDLKEAIEEAGMTGCEFEELQVSP